MTNSVYNIILKVWRRNFDKIYKNLNDFVEVKFWRGEILIFFY